jgi:hypothetical protein
MEMNDLESLSTQELWAAIEQNARDAQQHTRWVEYLDNVKICSAVIGGRIQRFEHERRIKQLLGNRRLTKKAGSIKIEEVKG